MKVANMMVATTRTRFERWAVSDMTYLSGCFAMPSSKAARQKGGKRRREMLLWFLGPCCGLCKANYPFGYTTKNRRSDGFAAAVMVNPVAS